MDLPSLSLSLSRFLLLHLLLFLSTLPLNSYIPGALFFAGKRSLEGEVELFVWDQWQFLSE